MYTDILSILLDANQLTGYEHTRTVVLLTLLAVISIIMWIIVSLSLILRFGVVLIMKYLHRKHLRKQVYVSTSQMSEQK
jgi:hypothetical protein